MVNNMTKSNILKVFKVNDLPTDVEANSIYIKKDSNYESFENGINICVSDKAGQIHRLMTNSEMHTAVSKIAARVLANKSSISIVESYTDLNSLSPDNGDSAYVKDASSDATVNSGGAYYIYSSASGNWIKTAEAESMDITIRWEDIADKPSSSTTDIDDAVAQRHTHENMAVLNSLGVETTKSREKVLTLNDQYIHITWDKSEW